MVNIILCCNNCYLHYVCISDSVCDFEKGLCGWSNTQNPSVDLLDWDLTSVQAEMFYSTPPYDHTLYTEEGDLCSKLTEKVFVTSSFLRN